jgi:hypothetical protein
MVGGVDLHGWSDLGAGADLDGDDVEDDAVEVEKDVLPQANVVAVVAEEWRPDDGAVSDRGEQLAQKLPPLVGGSGRGCVVTRHPCLGPRRVGLQFRVAGAIELAGEHFLFFGFHVASLALSSMFDDARTVRLPIA